jgi:hypothetical protein
MGIYVYMQNVDRGEGPNGFNRQNSLTFIFHLISVGLFCESIFST